MEKFEGGLEGGAGEDFTELRGCVNFDSRSRGENRTVPKSVLIVIPTVVFSRQKYRFEGWHHTFDSMLPYLM